MPRRSPLLRQTNPFGLSPMFSNTCALFFILSEVEGLAPSVCEGCASDLSLLLSVDYALFCAMEPSQPLSHQALPHSFPCNGGWWVPALAPSPVHSPFTPSCLLLFSSTYALPNRLSDEDSRPACLERSRRERAQRVEGSLPCHTPFTPTHLALFSTTYNSGNLQLICFDNVATVGGVGRATGQWPPATVRRGGASSSRFSNFDFRVSGFGRLYSEAPSGRKYCVPLTGSWRRRRSCCKSSLRSTKSISEVLITRRSEAEYRKKKCS